MRLQLLTVLLFVSGCLFAQRPTPVGGSPTPGMPNIEQQNPNGVTLDCKEPGKMSVWGGYGRPIIFPYMPPDTGMILLAVPSPTSGRSPLVYWEYICNIDGLGASITDAQLDTIAAQVQPDETRLTEGNILIYSRNGAEIGRDTISGAGNASTQREAELRPPPGVSVIQLNFDPDDNRPVQVYRNGIICETCTFNDNSPDDATVTLSQQTDAGEVFFFTYY